MMDSRSRRRCQVTSVRCLLSTTNRAGNEGRVLECQLVQLRQVGVRDRVLSLFVCVCVIGRDTCGQ